MRFVCLGAMEATKPYKFMGFGAVEATNTCRFIWFGAMDATKPIIYSVWGREGHQNL